jgi:hypothetical protein
MIAEFFPNYGVCHSRFCDHYFYVQISAEIQTTHDAAELQMESGTMNA